MYHVYLVYDLRTSQLTSHGASKELKQKLLPQGGPIGVRMHDFKSVVIAFCVRWNNVTHFKCARYHTHQATDYDPEKLDSLEPFGKTCPSPGSLFSLGTACVSHKWIQAAPVSSWWHHHYVGRVNADRLTSERAKR